MIEITPHDLITFFISGNDVISLESRPLNFRVTIHAYSLGPQMYFRSSLTRVLNQFRNKIVEDDIKSKYPEEFSTVDKVGSEKLFGSQSCSV